MDFRTCGTVGNIHSQLLHQRQRFCCRRCHCGLSGRIGRQAGRTARHRARFLCRRRGCRGSRRGGDDRHKAVHFGRRCVGHLGINSRTSLSFIIVVFVWINQNHR